jgi:hypothetical protein
VKVNRSQKLPALHLTKAQQNSRIKAAQTFASSPGRLGPDMFMGWGGDSGMSKMPVITNTGTVRVSVGDDPAHGPQFQDYYVMFNQAGKPSKLVAADD